MSRIVALGVACIVIGCSSSGDLAEQRDSGSPSDAHASTDVGSPSADGSGGSFATGELQCAMSLASACCRGNGPAIPCPAAWSNAAVCATTWAPGIPSAACGGYNVVLASSIDEPAAYWFYSATDGTLVATGWGDAEGFVCSGGPGSITIPADCISTWEGSPEIGCAVADAEAPPPEDYCQAIGLEPYLDAAVH